MVKIGIIGTGFGVRNQLPTFKKLPNCQVIALAGHDLTKTQAIAKENKIPFAYDNYQDLINNPEVDLICNPTPSNLHFDIALKTIKAKKHLLQEKPAALTSKQINKLIKASKHYPKFIGVNHSLRFNPVTIKIKELIDNKTLGQITSITINVYVNYSSNSQATWTWWDDHKQSGGQTVLGYGTHLMDLARYLTNFPLLTKGNLIDQVVDKTQPDKITNKIKKVTSPDQFRANLLFDNQINVSLMATLHSFGYKNFEIKILGSKGILLYDDLEGLRLSINNNQPLKEIPVKDHLSDINLGRSFISKSFKFLAERLIKHLNQPSASFDYCTLKQAYQNQLYLEKAGAKKL